MRRCGRLVDAVAPERIAGELVKLFALSPRPSVGLRLLVETGVLSRIVPEFDAAAGFDQRSRYHHLPVDEHTLLTVDEAARRTPNPCVRLAAFFHDFGKPAAYSEEALEDGGVAGHFYGHERISAEMAREILTRLRFSSAEGFPTGGVEEVCRLVRHHVVQLRADSTDRSIRRWIRRVGGREAALRLLELHWADRAAHRGGADESALGALVRRIEEAEPVPLSDHDLDLGGQEIMERFGLEGEAVGRLKSRLLDRVVDGAVPNRRRELLKEATRMLGEPPE
jgi:tRNA nucleotidyltransferase/poly(A) polymerase